MKKRRIISIILIFVILVTCFSGCKASNKKSIVGQWYNEKGKCLDIRSDGTWKLEDSYGTGTYKLLDDKETFEFTDFYGDTQESKINKDDLGQYIDFGYYGDFYKDAYPSKEEIEKVKAKNVVSLNPFDGIQYEVSGISPYCKIAINNQECNNEVRKYVTYKLDKDYYANGETAVVTAVISTNTSENSYILSSDNAKYDVSGQEEYLTAVSQDDIESIRKEVNDKITATVSASIGTSSLFGEDVGNDCLKKSNEYKAYEDQIYTTGDINIKSAVSKLNVIYFSCLKQQKENQINDRVSYNTLSFLYCIDFPADYTVHLRTAEDKVLHIQGKIYINIVARNIVKKPDGSIFWDDEQNNFDIFTSFDGIDNLVSNTVMDKSDSYNITKIEVK